MQSIFARRICDAWSCISRIFWHTSLVQQYVSNALCHAVVPRKGELYLYKEFEIWFKSLFCTISVLILQLSRGKFIGFRSFESSAWKGLELGKYWFFGMLRIFAKFFTSLHKRRVSLLSYWHVRYDINTLCFHVRQ